MFSFGELVVIVLVALVVLGPKKTHTLVRTIGMWVGRARVYMRNLGDELERESETGDVIRELRNVQGMMRDQASQFRASAADFEREARETVRQASEASSTAAVSSGADGPVSAVEAESTPEKQAGESTAQPDPVPPSPAAATERGAADVAENAPENVAGGTTAAPRSPAMTATGSVPPQDVADRGG